MRYSLTNSLGTKVRMKVIKKSSRVELGRSHARLIKNREARGVDAELSNDDAQLSYLDPRPRTVASIRDVSAGRLAWCGQF